MSLYKNCGWWKNFDCIFVFSVKSYVRNTVNLSCARIVFPSVIWLITPYAAAHCRVGGTTYLSSTPQGYNVECCRVECCGVKVAIHLCRHLGLQFDSVEQIPCALHLCSRKKQSVLFFFSKTAHEVSLRQGSWCLSILRFVFLFAGRTVGTMFHLQRWLKSSMCRPCL